MKFMKGDRVRLNMDCSYGERHWPGLNHQEIFPCEMGTVVVAVAPLVRVRVGVVFDSDPYCDLRAVNPSNLELINGLDQMLELLP